MDNELILNNYLLILKSTVEVFVHGTLESSNEEVRCTLKECLNDILSSQSDTYDLMTEYGFYKVNNVKSGCINQVIKKLESN